MNFFKYYNEINNESGQEKACNLINAYFGEIENNPIFDLDRAQFVFTKYVSPLGNIYVDNAGFDTFMGFWVFFIWFSIFAVIIYISGLYLLFKIFLVLILVAYYLYKMYKYRIGKCYGFLF